MKFDSPFALVCPIQHYSWGNYGDVSRIAKILGRAEESELPFAELWAGAHPSACGEIILPSGKVRLDALISEAPEAILGAKTVQEFGPHLPFLFKLLSVRTALSIQAHPDRSRAAVLHARDKKNYPDSNHKPEIAIALTTMEFLHGFRALSEIREAFENYPELSHLVGESITRKVFSQNAERSESDTVASVFRAVMTAAPELVAVQSRSLLSRTELLSGDGDELRWIHTLAPDYPEGDVGFFCFFLLNYQRLEPGEAIFIPPNVPHAYLSGELIECMASSDNVVRAGLTRKYRDVETLLEMLDYSVGKAPHETPVGDRKNRKVYSTPANEFQVEVLDEGAFEREVTQVEIFIVVSGSASIHAGGKSISLAAGDAFLVPADVQKYRLEVMRESMITLASPNTAAHS